MSKPRFIQLLTASRLFLAVVVAVLLTATDRPWWAIWTSLVLMGAMEISDLLDGLLARRWKVVTEFGKMFDPYADAVSRLIVYWSLSRIDLCWAVVPLCMAVRDVTVAYVRAALSGAGRDVSARWIGKTKAVIHGVAALLLLFVYAVLPSWSPYLVLPGSILVILCSLVAMVDHLIAAWPQIAGKLPPQLKILNYHAGAKRSESELPCRGKTFNVQNLNYGA